MIGGYDSGGFGGPVYHSSIMVLDLETLEWKEKTPMEHKRCYVGTVAIDGQIVAIGGHDGVVRHRSVEVYDPKTNIWTPMPSTITRRSDMATVVHNHVIYTIGGFTGQVFTYLCIMYNVHICLYTSTMFILYANFI